MYSRHRGGGSTKRQLSAVHSMAHGTPARPHREPSPCRVTLARMTDSASLPVMTARLPAPLLMLPRTLALALGVSLLLHLILVWGVRFVPPDPRSWFADRTLDVVLVNSRHSEAPKKADALAQANLNGAGNTIDPGLRARTPLPATGQRQDAPLPKVAQSPRPSVAPTPPSESEVISTAKSRPSPQQAIARQSPQHSGQGLNPTDLLAQAREIARLEGEIAEKTSALQSQPRRADFGGRTREYRFARYVEDWRLKIERVGNLNYPEEARRNGVYGSLILSVEINADGSLKNVRVDRSSGHTELDEAARRIVKLAAPYAPFSEALKRDFDYLRIVRTWTFTRENQLAAE